MRLSEAISFGVSQWWNQLTNHIQRLTQHREQRERGKRDRDGEFSLGDKDETNHISSAQPLGDPPALTRRN